MPTVLRLGPYRFFFYSNEGLEPAHIHVERDGAHCKFWLQPIALARSQGLPARELRRLEQIIGDRQQTFLEAWNEHFHPRG